MERFVHFLVIEPNPKRHSELRKLLSPAGTILLFAENIEEAKWELCRKEIGIVMFYPTKGDSGKTIEELKSFDKGKRSFFLALINEEFNNQEPYTFLEEGFTDFIHTNQDPKTIKAKLRVFKSLYQKDQRIGLLLSNIFPDQVLLDLQNFGKYSPKRIDIGVVMFTDFVNFSKKSFTLSPIEIVQKLEYYFAKFDEISKRYRLEKIKTIGDAYMTVAGVTEIYSEPILRTCLAALEIREWVKGEKLKAIENNLDPWEIRIGIHAGPLVAGILGNNKMSFDVWGDTVNLAARAQEVSLPGHITISKPVANSIEYYFNTENRGFIEIKNRHPNEEMFFLQALKKDHSLYGYGQVASSQILEKCGLPRMDFNSMRNEVLNRLTQDLDPSIVYHNVQHTLNVEKAAKRIALLEGLNEDERIILLTAVLYHDTGYLVRYKDNEDAAIKLAKEQLPKFGYDYQQIAMIVQIIASTKPSVRPVTLLEKIMSDADHDYFGRAEYYRTADLLRYEFELQNIYFEEEDWLHFQIEYLENQHVFYSSSSLSMRLPSKKRHISELKRKLNSLNSKKQKT